MPKNQEHWCPRAGDCRSQLSQRESVCPFPTVFLYSGRVSDPLYLVRAKELPGVPIQMLISVRERLSQMDPEMIYQLSGHLLAQSGWHIKLIITPDSWVSGYESWAGGSHDFCHISRVCPEGKEKTDPISFKPQEYEFLEVSVLIDFSVAWLRNSLSLFRFPFSPPHALSYWSLLIVSWVSGSKKCINLSIQVQKTSLYVTYWNGVLGINERKRKCNQKKETMSIS